MTNKYYKNLKKLSDTNKTDLNLEVLLKFAEKIDDELIISYVDGYLNKEDNLKFKKIIELDKSLEKEIQSLSLKNSFFQLQEEYKLEREKNELKRYIEFEKSLKKIKKVPEKNIIEVKSSFEKFLNFFKQFRIMDISYGALASCLIVFGFLTTPIKMTATNNPAIINFLAYNNNKDIFDQKIITRSAKCPKLNINEQNSSSKNLFKLLATNSLGKIFEVTNGDQLQTGTNLKFFLKYKFNQNIRVNYCNDFNGKTLNLIDEPYQSDGKKYIQIGKKVGYYVTPPVGKDTLSFTQNNDKEIFFSFSYNSIDLSSYKEKLKKTDWKKNKEHHQLPNKKIYKFYSNFFVQKFKPYKQIHQSWGMNKFDTNKFEKIYIDFDGDDKAEIIANDSNLDGNINFYQIDGNNNNITDALVYPVKLDNKSFFRWIIDNNEDKVFEEYSLDYNKDWVLDERKIF